MIADDAEDGEIAGDEAKGDDSADRPIAGCANLLADLLWSRLGGSDLCAEFFEDCTTLGEVAGICPPGQIGAGVDDAECLLKCRFVEPAVLPLHRGQRKPCDTGLIGIGE